MFQATLSLSGNQENILSSDIPRDIKTIHGSLHIFRQIKPEEQSASLKPCSNTILLIAVPSHFSLT